MPYKRLWKGKEYPDVAQAIAILNAVEVPGRESWVRYWSLHIFHNGEDWMVINSSHRIFMAKSEAEVASFVMGLFRATDVIHLVQAAGRVGREQETKGKDSPDNH